MPRINEMSTLDIDRKARLAFWQDGSSQIGGLHHNATNAQEFCGSARLAFLDQLKFGRISVSANEANWTRDLMKRNDRQFLRLVVQCRGIAHIEQGDARFVLRPGEWTVLNASRPHMIRNEEPIEELLVIVPEEAVVPRIFDASRRMTGAHSARTGAGRIMADFARSILAGESTERSVVDDHLEGAGIELIRAMIEETLASQTGTTCREVRVERITAYINRHLSDPSLSIQQIANAMGCSKRYVHSLFAGGQSVHSLIWASRLEKCARDLQRREMHGNSITTIALSHGFSCSAHFSRMFKAHHGMSPRDYRQRALDS